MSETQFGRFLVLKIYILFSRKKEQRSARVERGERRQGTDAITVKSEIIARVGREESGSDGSVQPADGV